MEIAVTTSQTRVTVEPVILAMALYHDYLVSDWPKMLFRRLPVSLTEWEVKMFDLGALSFMAGFTA